MASRNITIPMKDLKKVMKDWYEVYFERGDTSYNELFAAIRTFNSAGLISDEDYKKLFDYGHKLFQIICEVK